MPGPTKIPPRLHDEIWRRHSDAHTSQQIADWLAAEHEIEVVPRTVQYVVAKLRKEHEELVKSVKVEALKSTIQSDLEKLDEAFDRARSIEDICKKKEKYDIALRALDLQIRIVGQKNRLAGGSNADTAQTLADLLSLAHTV